MIARAMAEAGCHAAVFVATDYGEQALEQDEIDGPEIFARRLCEEEMAALLREHRPQAVIDATHPYAAIVSGNIRRAAQSTDVRYIRVLRPSTLPTEAADSAGIGADGLVFFRTVEEMVEWLNGTDETVFSTLGAKDLPALAKIRDFEKRVFVRILPTVEGISLCNELGFPMKHIVALHGPFSEEYNVSQFRAAGARIVITKDTGTAGGFDQKVSAARKLGLTVAVLSRPVDEKSDLSLAEVIGMIKGSKDGAKAARSPEPERL